MLERRAFVTLLKVILPKASLKLCDELLFRDLLGRGVESGSLI